MKAPVQAVNATIKTRRIAGHDIVLNVGFKDALIRVGIMILLPLVLLLIDKQMLIYTAPILAYLFITALTRFCLVKYAWHRYIKHQPPTVEPGYGKDQNYPEESI